VTRIDTETLSDSILICECSVEHERSSVARIHTRGEAVLSMRGVQLQGFTHTRGGSVEHERSSVARIHTHTHTRGEGSVEHERNSVARIHTRGGT